MRWQERKKEERGREREQERGRERKGEAEIDREKVRETDKDNIKTINSLGITQLPPRECQHLLSSWRHSRSILIAGASGNPLVTHK